MGQESILRDSIDQPESRIFVESIVGENLRARREACRSLRQEVEYALQLSESGPSDDGRLFNSNLRDRMVEILRSIDNLHFTVESLFACSMVHLGENVFNEAFGNLLTWIDVSLGQLSSSLQDISIYLTHRRYRNASSGFPVQQWTAKRRLRLSEIHLDYPDTLRAINCVVSDYFEFIRAAFLGKSRFPGLVHPVVVVGRGDTFSWEQFNEPDATPIYIYRKSFSQEILKDDTPYISLFMQTKGLADPTKVIRYGTHLINTSRVVSPRFFPVMMRYSPLLAHELFHPILRLSEVIFKAHDEITDFSGDMGKESLAGGLKRDYGSGLVDLTLRRITLESIMSGFLRRTYLCAKSANQLPSFSAEDFSYCLDNGRAKRIGFPKSSKFFHIASHDRDYLLAQKSEMFIGEILADLCGLVVANQSYLSALATNGYFTDASAYRLEQGRIVDLNFGEGEHPPMIVRLNILLRVARELGFSQTAQRIEDRLGVIGWQGRSNGLYEALWNVWEKWWSNPRTQEIYWELLSIFQERTKMSDLYRSCVILKFGEGQKVSVFDEDRLSQAFSVIVDRVASGKVHWDDMHHIKREIERRAKIDLPKDFRLRPSDLINAMWSNILDEEYQVCGRKRLQWRLALCNIEGGKGE